MAKAKSGKIVKRKPGRPVEISATEFVALRLPKELLRRVDAWAASNGVQRSEAIRRLIEGGLSGKRARQRQPDVP